MNSTNENPENSQSKATTASKSKFVTQLLELGPIIAFVGVWWWSGEPITATIALVGATAIQALLMLLLKIPINKIHKFTFAGIFILGGASIILDDPQIIKWKFTVVYWAFALLLLVGHFTKKNFMQRLFESLAEANPDIDIQITKQGWTKLNWVFILSFLIIGAINIYVTLYMDFNAWVNFKIAISVISFVFFPAVFIYFVISEKKHFAAIKTTIEENSTSVKNKKPTKSNI